MKAFVPTVVIDLSGLALNPYQNGHAHMPTRKCTASKATEPQLTRTERVQKQKGRLKSLKSKLKLGCYVSLVVAIKWRNWNFSFTYIHLDESYWPTLAIHWLFFKHNQQVKVFSCPVQYLYIYLYKRDHHVTCHTHSHSPEDEFVINTKKNRIILILV